ncbi:protein ced-11-like, partial [Centruroides sculpturatus]|uniref:protein ced-11-like n=1 Tax=Centruroides sculpturatus TaxID=218467 RepID=UPI000C6E55A1
NNQDLAFQLVENDPGTSTGKIVSETDLQTFEGTSSGYDKLNTCFQRQSSHAPSVAFGEEGMSKFSSTVGKICFWKNFAYETEGRPFLTTTHDANLEEIANILQSKWKIKSPRIVLVVISNVTSPHDWKNSRQLENFQKGLIKAANATDMWIVTQGINVGITKVIGDAVHLEQLRRQGLKCHKHPNQNSIKFIPLNLIGIVREDFLIYGDLFDGRLDRVEIENEGNCPEENKYELNPDHSHYIIVKDNTINKTGMNHFLLHLEQYMVSAVETSTPNQRNDDIETLSSNEIPVVALLIQGGYNCARLVLDHLKKQLPVVVLYGSGGLADLIAHAYYEIQYRLQGCWDAEFVENSLKPDLTSKITRNFPRLRDNTLARNIFRDRILECVRYSHQNTQVYLTILNLHGHSIGLENLDEHLLRSLFKAQRPEHSNWHANMRKDLYLTLDWNTPHVATSEVFMKDPSNKFRIDKAIFDEALLRPNREEFVDLFLNQGFRVHKYLTPQRLKMIFSKARRKEFFQSVCWEGVLGHGMERKLGKNFVERDLNWLIEHVTGIPNFVNPQELSLNGMGMYASDPTSAERKALTILIMWAVFTNRPKLCKLLWRHSDQPVHVALIVSMIYERLSSYVHEMGMKSEMMERSQQFADMATAVLDASYNDASCRAYDILSEESADWSYKTAVDIAADARNRTFLAHPCCQKWLTSMFLGKISIRDVTWGVITFPQWLKIILCAFLIFPMYIWIRFKSEPWNTFSSVEDETDDDNDDDDNDDTMTNGKKYVYENSNSVRYEFPFGHGKHRQQVATLLREKEVFIRAPPPIWKMIYWMWSAPITKFWIFQLFYMFYLGIFSVAVLAPSCGILILDIIVCSWTFLIAIENIRRAYILFKKYTSVPLFLKCVEILLIIAFVVLYVLGRILNVGIFLKPYNGKILLCVGLLYFYYRLIAIYLPISPTLGPLLYRVKLMVLVDFVNFMRMTMLVIISGGIVIQATLYPDFPLDTELFRRAFHRAWFSLFITPIDELQGKDWCREKGNINNITSCSNIGKYADKFCPNDGLWPYIFSIQYFVLLKLILLTLLYALFSATASKLQMETDAIWKFQRYQLVVDFANRSCLPPPLCVISYIYIIFKWVLKCLTCAFCQKQDQVDALCVKAEDKSSLSEKDYNYWRQLAQDYLSKEEEKDRDKDKLSKQMEAILNMTDDLDYQKKILKQLKGRMRELEHTVRVSQVYLESIKHITEKHEEHAGPSIHILSRHSPYPGTKIQRFPVPDKYVPWEVMWTEYDPVAYTKPLCDFPIEIQSYVDEDILLIYEGDKKDKTLPILQWNTINVNVAGVYTNRKSWMVDSDGIPLIYKLDSENLPRNPMGRSGIRGKGILPRWGPNHYIYIIITRWQRSKLPIAGGKGLEVIVMKNEKNQITLPGSFVGADNQYQMLANLFKLDKSKWQNKEEMLQFFQGCAHLEEGKDSSGSEMKGQQLLVGYMDDPCNTDQAWREVELWHIHYSEMETLGEKLQSPLFWRLITEDIFMKLPPGQALLLQEVTHNLQPSII